MEKGEISDKNINNIIYSLTHLLREERHKDNLDTTFARWIITVKHYRIMDRCEPVDRDFTWRGIKWIVLNEVKENSIRSIVWEVFLEKEATEMNLIAGRELNLNRSLTPSTWS